MSQKGKSDMDDVECCPWILDFNLEASYVAPLESLQDEAPNTRRILVIAGSDSSGGAGLEADQKVIAAHGCYAMTATTALTAQNTVGVFDIHHIPPSFVSRQIDACIDDIGVDVVKIGMLASADTVKAVAETLRCQSQGCPVVLDPVMVSTSGSQLLPPDAVSHLLRDLVPMATVITPNIPEAKLLTGREKDPEPQTQEEMIDLARTLHALGPKYVLVKGGHLQSRDGKKVGERHKIVDVLFDGQEATVVEKDHLDRENTHGTGCSLASAIASNLALGYQMQGAVQKACRYVEAGIRTSINRGKGNGPINHFHSSYTLPFVSEYFMEYMLRRLDIIDRWKGYTDNRFLKELAQGSLPSEKFEYYLSQDYHLLVQFARHKALAASKAKSLEDIVRGTDEVLKIERDVDAHIGCCESFGISKNQIEATEQCQASAAYTSYVHDIGNSEDWFALQVALMAYSIGYVLVARQLYDSPHTSRGGSNRYWPWIAKLIAQERLLFADKGRDVLERFAVLQSPNRIEELVKIFDSVTKLTAGLWNM